MTIVNYVKDHRVSRPKIDGGTYIWGLYETRNTSGGDRTAADKAAGRFPPHPYSGTRTFSLFGDYHVTWTEWGVTHTGRDAMPGGTGIAVYQERIWDSNDELVLLGRLADKIRGHNWHAGVFVGELGKTVDMLAARVKQLARAALAVKRGQIKEAFKLLQVLPQYGHSVEYRTWSQSRTMTWYGFWLEMRYGWRPLINDIYELSEAIRTLDVPRKAVFRCSHSIGKSIASNAPSLFEAKGTGKYSKQIIATYEEKPFSLPEHLGLDNPWSLAWELLPFSFVVDWLTPIGNYIQTRHTLQRAGGSFVRTTFDWHRGRIVGMAPGYTPDITPPLTSEISDPSGWSHSYTIDRTVVSVLAVPLPVFRNPLGHSPATRLTDAIALLTAVFGGKPKTVQDRYVSSSSYGD